MRPVDHIVYAVPNLETAIADLHQRLGVRPVFGGYHRDQGTKNALLNLGKGCYLEILAADPDNTIVAPSRWMGIDLLTEPKITRWSLKATDLAADAAALHAHDPQLGQLHRGQRQTASGDMLAWEMSLPLAAPEVEIAPFITAWQDDSPHPTDSLIESCTLQEVLLTAPQPEVYATLFQQLGLGQMVKRAAQQSIEVVLSTPFGVVKL